MSKQVTVDDLWPGDVIIARRPGAYCGLPSRVSYVEREDKPHLARIHLDRDGYEFSLITRWDEIAEVVG